MKTHARETWWVGWDSPTLPLAAQALADRYHRGDELDLRGCLCVLPTTRSVHAMGLELEKRAPRQATYQPPQIITVGELPERLYQPVSPPAGDFDQLMAWAKVISEYDRDRMSALVPTLPAKSSLTSWLELASTIGHLREELALNNRSFADVVPQAESNHERKRWELLAELSRHYEEELAGAGLSDPHSARAHAIDSQACQSDQTIILIATSDLSDMLVSMLSGVNANVISMVAAPPEAANRFNEFGCVITEKWLAHPLPLADENLLPAGDISDQATAALQTLEQWKVETQSTAKAVIGVTDPSQVGPIEMELRGGGYTTFRSQGWKISETAVGRLLRVTSAYVQSPTWRSLATLVRHAHVSRAISGAIETETSDWLTQVDGVINNHHPQRIEVELPAIAQKRYPLAIKVARWVRDWLSDFFPARSGDETPTKPLSQWSELVLGLLRSTTSDHPRTVMAMASAENTLRRLVALCRSLDRDVSGSVAMEVLAGRLAEVRVMDGWADDAVSIVGWLDLALEGADFLTVVGLNHPFVPATVTSDPFLPGALRSRLRMQDNDRRCARDIYAMHLMLSTTVRARFIVGKTGADQSPTPPSRLIAAAAPSDMARRVRFLLQGERSLPATAHRWDHGPSRTEIPIPKLSTKRHRGKAISEMSVTSFGDYLKCPYRFYLRHVLRLKPLDDANRELAANQFGDLVHGSLEQFGQSNQKDATEVSKIESALIEHLHQYANEHYGDDVSPAVRLQIAQAERRLKTVAIRQAERINQGWLIHATEKSVSEASGAMIKIDEGEMGIRGRFDRIDHHPDTGRWAILDYKTHGHPPQKKHLKKVGRQWKWIDLQLPLYRMMAPFLGIETPPNEVELGYFNVAQKDSETKINLADFSPDQMAVAEEIIHDCVRGVLLEQFEPSDESLEYDDYSMILQTGIMNAGSLDHAVDGAQR